MRLNSTSQPEAHRRLRLEASFFPFCFPDVLLSTFLPSMVVFLRQRPHGSFLESLFGSL